MEYKSLKLQNFTVFRDAEFEFVPGVNVFVGENGTGKTHVLKALYALQLAAKDVDQGAPSLKSIFQIDDLNELLSFSAGPGSEPNVEAHLLRGRVWRLDIAAGFATWKVPIDPIADSITRPVFIPSVDMLSHTRRFNATYNLYKIDFDQTCRDIVSLLLSPELRDIDDIGIDLAGLTGGAATAVDEQDERFYITTSAGRFAAPMVADGARKLASLVLLIRNGWIRTGTTLFWDEPEVGVNPSLMTQLVDAILKLANVGVQVFLATNSYFLLKELDLQAKHGQVRFFALQPTSSGVTVNAADSYDELEPNKIMEQFDSIFDRQITRATGRTRKGANGS